MIPAIANDPSWDYKLSYFVQHEKRINLIRKKIFFQTFNLVGLSLKSNFSPVCGGWTGPGAAARAGPVP